MVNMKISDKGVEIGAMPPLCATEVFAHRDYLVAYARRKLHDPALAEDVVHDVFEAVLALHDAYIAGAPAEP